MKVGDAVRIVPHTHQYYGGEQEQRAVAAGTIVNDGGRNSSGEQMWYVRTSYAYSQSEPGIVTYARRDGVELIIESLLTEKPE